VFKEYRLTSTFWPDTNIENHVLYWDNGKIQVEYKLVKDSIRIRNEYFQNGRLKLTAEIYQTLWIDTSMELNHVTRELEAVISSGYVDILHGRYQEHWKAHWNVKPKTSGTFNKNLMVGEWAKRTRNGELSTALYNAKGQLEGPYYAYYYFGSNERSNVKWKGQYEVFRYRERQEDLETGEPIVVEIIGSKKAGTWKHFSLDGQLLQTVEHKWVGH